MRAIAIVPGRRETAGVVDLPEPPASDGSVQVRTRLIGICGTDVESTSRASSVSSVQTVSRWAACW